jgi:carbamoyltransferase
MNTPRPLPAGDGMKDFFLGFHTSHNATVALLKDGAVEACVSEERFSGQKNHVGYPRLSLDYLSRDFRAQGSSFENVNIPNRHLAPQLAVGETLGTRQQSLFSKALYMGYSAAQKISVQLKFVRPWIEAAYRLYCRTISISNAEKEKSQFAAAMGLQVSQVLRHDHHLCHAYAAYYGSPYQGQDALVMTLDGEGDNVCATVSTVRQGKWERLAVSPSNVSPGLLYMWLTVHLGMKANEHEYKVMGLAAYAKEAYIAKLYERLAPLLYFGNEDPLVWRSAFDMHAALPWLEKELKGERFDVIAGAFQKLVEDRVAQWVASAIRLTGLSTVCLGGGVFMNVKANMRVAQLPALERLFVFPSCGDDSVAVGAAMAGYRAAKGPEATFSSVDGVYWGPAFSDAQVAEFLTSVNAGEKYKVQRFDDIEDKIAELLERHAIVARLAGRMEYGARALGNRSILANPSNPDNVRVINEQMKNRDFWMPFAGTLLEERVDDYLENPKKIFSPHMMIAFPTKPLARQELRAAIHPYDFTIRPQMLRQSTNPSYHKILKAFERRTGIGGVLNTSFNLHGFPIVLGPKEAFHAFENSGLTHLAMENHLISKA